MSRGIGRAVQAAVDLLKLVVSSTAATVRFLIVSILLTGLFVAVFWLAHSQGWFSDFQTLIDVPNELLQHPVAGTQLRW